MLKTCSRCGGTHPVGTRGCPDKPRWERRTDSEAAIRNTSRWRRTRDQVKQEQKHLCQVCLTGAFGTVDEYTHEALEVHHIHPLEQAPERAYDHTNLITLCRFHHEMAERGDIPQFVQERLVAYKGQLAKIQREASKILKTPLP